MENQHRKIAGYRDLSQTEIDLMNEAKALERKFNSLIDKLRSTAGLDQRNVALAQTHGEDAFMRAVRAVAQPERQTEETAKFERMDAEIAPSFAHQAPVPQVDTPEGMARYVGTKIIDARPMTRAVYNQFRGWALPADEDGEEEGYLVHYTDGGKPNVEGYPGYVSWTPAFAFDQAYRPL